MNPVLDSMIYSKTSSRANGCDAHKMKKLWPLLAIFLFGCSCGFASPRFDGIISFASSGNLVSYNIQQIYNDNASFTTGSIAVEVYGTYLPYYGIGLVYGTFLYGDFLNPLNPGYAYNNLNGIVAFNDSPTNYVYLLVLLKEYNGFQYVLTDFINVRVSSYFPIYYTAPSINSHPSSNTVNIGGNVTFSVSASGSGPLSYQWKKNGANISGATGSNWSISNVQLADAGSYAVSVTNEAGTVTSNAAVLTVNSPVTVPVITNHPGNLLVDEGDPASFSVSVSSSTSVSYQWKKDGTNISGANSSTYSIAETVLSDAGIYSVTVSNTAGSLTSQSASLQVRAQQTVGNLEGWSYLAFPWVYSLDSGSWFYLYGDPWFYMPHSGVYDVMSNSLIDGWIHKGNNGPWAYSTVGQNYCYIYGPVWVYDLRNGSFFTIPVDKVKSIPGKPTYDIPLETGSLTIVGLQQSDGMDYSSKLNELLGFDDIVMVDSSQETIVVKRFGGEIIGRGRFNFEMYIPNCVKIEVANLSALFLTSDGEVIGYPSNPPNAISNAIDICISRSGGGLAVLNDGTTISWPEAASWASFVPTSNKLVKASVWHDDGLAINDSGDLLYWKKGEVTTTENLPSPVNKLITSIGGLSGIGLFAILDNGEVLKFDERHFSLPQSPVKDIEIGYKHVIFLLEDGTLYASGHSGFNKFGQSNVSSFNNVIDIACGYDFTAILLAE